MFGTGRAARATYLWAVVLALLPLVSTAATDEQATQEAAGSTARLAVERIRTGRYVTMPDPTRACADGPVGEGVTLENGSGLPLTVYFSGPLTRVVQVQPGESRGVDLVVGHYEAAAEAADASVLPFYGALQFEGRTHYWLRFHTQGSVPRETPPSGADEMVDIFHTALTDRNFRRLKQSVPFQDGYLIGYSWGSAITDKGNGAVLRPEAGSRFVLIEIEYSKGPIQLYPPAYNAVVLSVQDKRFLYRGWPMNGGWATIFPDKFPKGMTMEAPSYPFYIAIPFEIPTSISELVLTFGSHSELIAIPR
jgi:hypothetical protein